MSDTESTPALFGASDAPIPAENGSREVENASPPPGSDGSAGSDDGVGAPTGGSQAILAPGVPNPQNGSSDGFIGEIGTAPNGKAAVATTSTTNGSSDDYDAISP